MSKMSNEALIFDETVAEYKKLLSFYNSNNDNDMEMMVKMLFTLLRGIVYITSRSDKYVSYDGKVEEYTICGSVSKEYVDADFNRLIEDLTMAFYKNNGGQLYTYTPNLITEIKKSIA